MGYQIKSTALPPEDQICSRQKFIVNNIEPISLRAMGKDIFLILFRATQSYDDSAMYLQCMFMVDNPFECSHVKSRPYYFHNIQKDEDTKKEYSEKIQGMINAQGSTLFGTDFSFFTDSEHNGYFICTTVQVVDRNQYAVMDAYFNKDCFIQIKAYLNRLVQPRDASDIFEDELYSNIEFVKVEQIKLDATAEVQDKSLSRKMYMTHYTFNCGPSTYYANVSSEIRTKRIRRVPLNEPAYMTFYQNHDIVTDAFECGDYVYVINKEFIPDTGKQRAKVLRVLVFDQDGIKQTNIIERDNRIYKEKK